MDTVKPSLKTPSSLPSWLVVSDQGALITLSTPATIKDVKVEKLNLRTPTVRDLRACQKMHPNDELEQDAMLFCSLAEIGPADLQGLSLKDYERVKSGYFRLVTEDEF